MDTLTGNNDYPSNHHDLMTPSQSETIQSNKHYKSFDGKAFADFLQGSSYQLSPQLFALVSNLDPMEISDYEFLRAARTFSDEDFVRAVYLAYLRREPTSSNLQFWTTEIKLKKGRRSYLLKWIKNNLDYLANPAQKSKNYSWLKIILKPINFLSQFVSKLIRTLLKIEYLEILAAVNFIHEQNEFLLGAWIDQPKTGAKIKKSTYIIAGWVVGKDSQPVTIRLVNNEKVISQVPMTVARPDITKTYCVASKTHTWGFDILLNIKQLSNQGNLQLQAIFSDSNIVTIGLIKFRKY
jgi:hypothetical protein